MKKRWEYFVFTALTPIILTGLTAILLLNYWYAPSLLDPQVGPAYTVVAKEIPDKPSIIKGKPKRLVVPSADIDIKVAEGYFYASTNSWTLSEDKAHWANLTVIPNNNSGNTFIYGHNLPQVFSKLSEIKKGDKAYVYTKNDHVFTYEYKKKNTTSPNDLSLFEYEGDPMLTLQTCSGLWYQNRDLLWFELVEVN